MIEMIKEHSWWISLVLAVVGIIISIYPQESKACLTKIVLFVIKPNTIIITLLLAIVVILVKHPY